MKQVYNFLLSIILSVLISNMLYSQEDVTVSVDAGAKTASMGNGIVSLTIDSKGQVNSLTYNAKDLIDAANKGRFYFSYNDQDSYEELSPDAVRIEKQTADYAEVVYSNTSREVHVEQAYILLKGVSGIYCYVTVKGTSTPVTLREIRVVYRVSPLLFYYGYVTDSMQGELPSIDDMIIANDNPIMDATYLLPGGSVYTKYDWANYIVEDSVHGILSDNEGVWAIAPSNEFMNGGPMKQELTVHTTTKTPLALQMLQGEHFGASSQEFTEGDEKIYGPFFIYVNSGSTHEEMIEDAKMQASLQKSLWPYEWLTNPLYPLDRTVVTGQINIPLGLPVNNIQVVLAEPGIDLYDQGKKYMYWVLTDSEGRFVIPHVREDEYTLYAYATEGEITEMLTVDNIEVSGDSLDLGTIDWYITKYENKLWQIGDNDRLTKGFILSDTLRAYGLYERPPQNLDYQVGTSTPENDWYYAQTKAGTWTVSFNCDTTYSGFAYLTASIAGATRDPEVEIYVNDDLKGKWTFGNDASVYRSAVLSGRHEVKQLPFLASSLIKGENTIKFKMTSVGDRGGLMYDCIKLETGSVLTSIGETFSSVTQSTVSNYPNPFDNYTCFKINTNSGGNASLIIYNLHGQLVDIVFDGTVNAGIHEIVYNTSALQEGLYIYRFTTNDQSITGKIQKVK